MPANEALAFLISPPNTLLFLGVKVIFLALTLFFLGTIFYGLFRTSWADHYFLRDVREIATFRPYAVHRMVKSWQRIVSRLDSGIESEYKLAVIEADGILDDILKRMGYSGDSLGERLKLITPDIIPNLQDVLEAHKTRNNIVHDPDYRLLLEEAKRAINAYETTLSALQAL